jgi:hypothetical protein
MGKMGKLKPHCHSKYISRIIKDILNMTSKRMYDKIVIFKSIISIFVLLAMKELAGKYKISMSTKSDFLIGSGVVTGEFSP